MPATVTDDVARATRSGALGPRERSALGGVQGPRP